MPWNIAQAKQRFSEIVRRAAEGPQLIYNRKRLVAAVIDAELHQIMQEESYELTLPPRSTRRSAFIETLKEEGCELPR